MKHSGILPSESSLTHGHYFNGKIYDVDLTGRYAKRAICITRAGRIFGGTYWDFGKD